MHSEEVAVEDPRITILEDGFLMTQGDATLRATFLYPARPQVRLVQRRTYTRNNVEIIRIDESTGILVEGDGSYLVVLTLQEGDAPAVQTVHAGEGRYRVGNQPVTFSGGRLHIGTP